MSLVANGFVLLLVTALLWACPHVSPGAAMFSFVTPPWFGVECLLRGDVAWAIPSLAVTIMAVLFASLAIRTPRRVPIICAHLALVVYFLWGLVIVGLAV